MTLVLALVGLATAADCPEAVPADAVTAHMQDAILAFATLDEESFFASTGEAQASLPCLNEVFLPPNSAAFHRMVAMNGFMEGDGDAAKLSFQSAFRVEPDFKLSSKVAPEGGKLWRLADEARQQPSSLMAGFKPPPGLVAYVDGKKATERPANVPAVVQFTTKAGEVLWTGYVPAGGHLPDDIAGAEAVADAADDTAEDTVEVAEPVIDDPPEPEEIEPKPPKEVKPEPLPTKPPKSGGGGNTLVMAGAGAGAAAAVLFGASVGARMAFDNQPSGTMYHVTNGTHYASIGAGIAAGGLLVAGLAGGK